MDAAIVTEEGSTRRWPARALLCIGVLASALVVAAVWNPWRLLVFDEHLARWVLVALFGVECVIAGAWSTMLGAGTWKGLTALMLAPALLVWAGYSFERKIYGRHDADGCCSVIGATNDGVRVLRAWPAYTPSDCVTVELRSGSGLTTVHQRYAGCLRDQGDVPDLTIDGDRLTLSGGTTLCEYEVTSALSLRWVSGCTVLASR